MELTEEITNLLYRQGADLVGIGDKCFAVCSYTKKYLKEKTL